MGTLKLVSTPSWINKIILNLEPKRGELYLTCLQTKRARSQLPGCGDRRPIVRRRPEPSDGGTETRCVQITHLFICFIFTSANCWCPFPSVPQVSPSSQWAWPGHPRMTCWRCHRSQRTITPSSPESSLAWRSSSSRWSEESAETSPRTTERSAADRSGDGRGLRWICQTWTQTHLLIN